MKTREEVLDLLGREKSRWEGRFKLRRMALFGSYARGEQQEDSDVDILVDVDPSIGLEFVTLADQIEELLGIPAEVVSVRAIKPRNWEVIERELIDVE